MAIADKLTQLNNVKQAIKEGLQSKLDLNLSSTPFTDYATQINTIINRGAQTKTFTPSTSSQSYTIPKGYHNGNGKVTCNAILKEIAIISCEKSVATVCGFGEIGGTWAEYHGITTGFVGNYVKTYRSGNYCYIEVTKACKGFDKTLTLKSYSVGTKLSINVSNESSTNFLVVVSE